MVAPCDLGSGLVKTKLRSGWEVALPPILLETGPALRLGWLGAFASTLITCDLLSGHSPVILLPTKPAPTSANEVQVD